MRVDKLFEWKILYEKYEKNVGNGNVNCVGAEYAGRGMGECGSEGEAEKETQNELWKKASRKSNTKSKSCQCVCACVCVTEYLTRCLLGQSKW